MVLIVLLVDGHVLEDTHLTFVRTDLLQRLRPQLVVIIDVQGLKLFNVVKELVLEGVGKFRYLHMIVLLFAFVWVWWASASPTSGLSSWGVWLAATIAWRRHVSFRASLLSHGCLILRPVRLYQKFLSRCVLMLGNLRILDWLVLGAEQGISFRACLNVHHFCVYRQFSTIQSNACILKR